MKRSILVAVLTAIASFEGNARADGCLDGPGCVDYGGLGTVVGVGYTNLTAPFIVNDLLGKDHGKEYSLVEALIHTPLTIGFTLYTWKGFDTGPPSAAPRVMAGALALMHGTLAARPRAHTRRGRDRFRRRVLIVTVPSDDNGQSRDLARYLDLHRAGLEYSGRF